MIKHNPKENPPPKDRTILADFGKGTVQALFDCDGSDYADVPNGNSSFLTSRMFNDEVWGTSIDDSFADGEDMLCWWDLPKGGE